MFKEVAGKGDFTSYIVSEIKRRLVSELNVSASVVSPKSENLKIKFSRHVYATFFCSRCSNSWSSAKATCEIQYLIKYGEHVLFYVHVYRQKCLKCDTFGVARAGEDQMNWIVDAFTQKVSDIISGVKKPKKTGEKALVNMAGPHKSELCEACMLGKCTQKDNALGESSKSKYDTDISKMLRELAAMKF